ncbi:MAG: hypothetical protein V3U78_02340 [Thiotrichaceae bacterium]
MKLRHITMSTLLALGVAFSPLASAGNSAEKIELGTPVVALMPHVKELRADLGLNKEQNALLDQWIANAPAKRKELETEAVALHLELREALLNGESRIKREELKKALAEKTTRIVEMRSLCVRMLRKTLNKEQFEKVVASYRAGQ